jgi:hypothetical protein
MAQDKGEQELRCRCGHTQKDHFLIGRINGAPDYYCSGKLYAYPGGPAQACRCTYWSHHQDK